MSANLGWLFYKDYFDGVVYKNMDTDSVKKSNELHVEKKINDLIKIKPDIETRADEDTLGNSHFKATTTYPGLLLGIGNGHELPSVKGQAILGFHFDYTTGLPEITGSSIKGVLRSAFNAKDGYGYIMELLEQIDEALSLGEKELQALEEEIFGKSNGSKSTAQGKDVFFDAYIINTVGNILGDDYITPHGDNPLTEPIPLRFIKVLPEVTFMFDFELSSSALLGAVDKRKLFMMILEDLGLGAKTNVGYGYFENYAIVRTEAEKVEEDRIYEENSYKEALASDDIEKPKAFKVKYPKYINIDKIEKKIKELEDNVEVVNLQKAWDNIDKNNKKYIESFIKKHQNNPLAQAMIVEAKSLLEDTHKEIQIDFETFMTLKSLKEITAQLKKYNKKLSDDEVTRLITHIKSDNCNKKIKKFDYPLFKKKLGNIEGQSLGDFLK